MRSQDVIGHHVDRVIDKLEEYSNDAVKAIGDVYGTVKLLSLFDNHQDKEYAGEYIGDNYKIVTTVTIEDKGNFELVQSVVSNFYYQEDDDDEYVFLCLCSANTDQIARLL